MTSRLPALLIALLLSTACAVQPVQPPGTVPPVQFPTQGSTAGERDVMEAQLFGTLVVKDGCLLVNADEGHAQYQPIWPSGYSVNTAADPVEIRDATGAVVVRVGDAVYLSGGEMPNSGDATNCPQQKWIVGNIVERTTEPKGVAYISEEGGYSIMLPAHATVYENQRPSVDGVLTATPDTLTIQAAAFVLTLTHFGNVSTGTSLARFAETQVECAAIQQGGGVQTEIGNTTFLTYIDVPCGPRGISYFFTLSGTTGYRIGIEYLDSYASIKGEVDDILETFQPLDLDTRN